MSAPSKRLTSYDLFLELAEPDEKWFSRWVHIDKFVGRYKSLYFRNGLSWGRMGSRLHNEFLIEKRRTGNKITEICLNGLNVKPAIKNPPTDTVRREIKKQRCLILNTGKPEVDHKDGRNSDPIDTNDSGNFQPLSKAANDAKRQHCKDCRSSGLRFDAQKLGYSVSQIEGGARYEGTCVGCYWYDPKLFNQTVSAGFSPPTK